MAGALVGGAFLSSFINVVFDRLSSPEVANFIRGKKLDIKLLQRLETTLYAVQAVLNDAEHKQIYDEAVKKWLDDLKDAVYVADDLLDKVSTEAATQKEVSNFLSRFLNLRDRKVVSEIEDITSRLENIVKYKDILGLKEIPRENLSWRTPSTSLVKGDIYGREQDQDAIIKILSENSEDNISVIPIVGMGGVGKTTLAQWVFNNENLMRKFDLKAWVCVSEESNIAKITKTVIEELTGGPCNLPTLNLLQNDLKDKLTGKKFCVVLDDVWNIDSDGWNILKAPFQNEITGSKILVTTRSDSVASAFKSADGSSVQTCTPYRLHGLSDQHCWSILAKNACFPESSGNPTLEKIGRKIVERCKGLPLAAETLGRLLQTHEMNSWNSILNSKFWELPIEESKIIPALRISYYHLPPHLKRCFVYCSLYPKDRAFRKDALILFWMAEDLLPQPKTTETLEQVGSKCFNDLASRSFFKQFNTDDDQIFVMHDLMHDLAISVAGDFYSLSEELGNDDKITIRTRHLSCESISEDISAVDKSKSLRTFLSINLWYCSLNFESAEFILSKLKYLRVLSFSDSLELDALPDSIGELIHLRYLDLSFTSIKALPESLSNLYNLQTLKLCCCDKLTMLPSEMRNLVNLRHLDIRQTRVKEIPPGLIKLKHLQLLCGLVVGEHEENGIKELGSFSGLHGSLCIKKLENVTIDEAGEAMIMDKTHIEDLMLEWSSDDDMATTSTPTEREKCDKLQPHKGLKELRIRGYRGTIFPDWVGHSSYHKMTRVRLDSCRNCCILPSLGQLPSLKSLKIEDFDSLVEIGPEFYKSENDHSSLETPFPSLEHLSFRRMSRWEKWCSSESDAAFPKLEELEISFCPSFMGDLPSHLPALEKLVIKECKKYTFPLETFPNLRSLIIVECENMESILVSQSLLSTLQELSFGSCHNLVSFPIEGFAAPSMTRLSLWDCNKLTSLPCDMNALLPKLEELNIRNCPEIDSFPEGGLPPNLTSLQISNCEKLLSSISSMGMHQGLTSLSLSCEFVKSFPKEGFLPQLPSLTTLVLWEFNNMETLNCKELLHLTSLQTLTINDCPKLQNMAGERLPPSLKQLNMWESPLLEERCNTKHPLIWPKISHIPSIRANH